MQTIRILLIVGRSHTIYFFRCYLQQVSVMLHQLKVVMYLFCIYFTANWFSYHGQFRKGMGKRYILISDAIACFTDVLQTCVTSQTLSG